MTDENISNKEQTSKLTTFLQRLTSTIILLAVFGGALYFNDTVLYAGVLCLLSLMTSFEWYKMLKVSGKPAQPKISFWCNILLILLVFSAVYASQSGDPGMVIFMFVLLSVLVVPITAIITFTYAMRKPIEGTNSLQEVGTSILSLIYPNGMFLAGALLLFYSQSQFASYGLTDGVAYLIFVLLITKGSDIFAYISGVLLGGKFFTKKLIPHISPKKSWEGIIGSFILTQIFGFLLAYCLLESLVWSNGFSLSDLHSLYLFIFIAVMFVLAVIGDLAGSLIKRSLSVKDSGSLLPGIGGIFDLIDSPAFTLPIATALWIICFLS